MEHKELLRVEQLDKSFRAQGRRGQLIHAVDRVSLSIRRGETFGLVGESGSGKTTLGRLILRLTQPDSGRILYAGQDITHADMRPLRRNMQIVFQNPSGSLDPAMRVRDIVAEGLDAKACPGGKAAVTDAVARLLESVGLSPADLYRYPGEFSGGQQQRIGIARALAVEPEFLVCDEPVSALDVSYQSQILQLLTALKQQRELTYLFISHDLSVVMHMADRVGVMYRGRLVELGSREDIVLRPAHPYTRALLSAVPIPDPRLSRARERRELSAESFLAPTHGGCRYYPRCPRATAACAAAQPELRELSFGHFCACAAAP